jgi:hypothetical protein
MNGRTALSPATALAAERQPANFEGLDASVVAVDDLAVTRAIACPCGSQTGFVLAGGEAPEGGWLDPLTWICSSCGTSRLFFDSARDGYDGRFGHGTTYMQGSEQAGIACPECGGETLRVRCDLIYNIDPSELAEDLAPGNAGHFTDYFDWLNVTAECASCHQAFAVGDWELA